MPDYFEAEKIFASLSGMSMEETRQLEELILISYYGVLGRLKKDALTEQGAGLLNRLIAVDAWYRYLLSHEVSDDISEIKMLDVSISKQKDSGKLSRAKELREELRKEAGSFLLDEEFVFQTI